MIFPIENRDQRSLIACGVVFGLLPVVFVSMRVLARRIANRKLEASDYLIIAACAFVVCYQGVVISSVITGGLGLHAKDIEGRFGVDTGIMTFMKHLVTIQVLWTISLGLCKISILMLCSRVFVVRGFIIAAKGTAVLILLWALATIISCFTICQPFAYNWDLSIKGGSCGNSMISWIVTGVLNIVTDMIVLLLPMPYLFGLDLALYKKLVVAGMFGVGLFTCIISIIRVVTLTTVDFTDVTYTIPHTVLFSALEPCLAITLACVPVLRPIFGGRYSTTGTAKFGPPTRKTLTQKSSRRFRQFNENGSEAQLRPGQLESQTHIAANGASSLQIPTAQEEGGDVELGSITGSQEWGVDEGISKQTSKASDGTTKS